MRRSPAMKRIRPFLAAAAALAAASGIALLPALMSAAPASAAASCTGTSLVAAVGGGNVRIPTIGNGTGSWQCELGLGNDSAAVGRLQIGLNNCNLHAGLTVDNDYGSLTRQAVINFQHAHSLSADGIYGPATGGSMKWPVSGSSRCAFFKL
jgi:hypothetical protein